MAELDKTQPNQFEKEGMNPFNAPIPGESLTRDPEQRFPWEQNPQITDVDTAIKEIFITLTEKNSLVELLNILNNGQPVDEIAQVIKYNSDLMLLLLEPLMYLIIAIAEEYEIDPVIYEGMDNDIADAEDTQASMAKLQTKKINKDSVPASLLARVKELPSQEELREEQ
mgnify:CR=1 FL=1